MTTWSSCCRCSSSQIDLGGTVLNPKQERPNSRRRLQDTQNAGSCLCEQPGVAHAVCCGVYAGAGESAEECIQIKGCLEREVFRTLRWDIPRLLFRGREMSKSYLLLTGEQFHNVRPHGSSFDLMRYNMLPYATYLQHITGAISSGHQMNDQLIQPSDPNFRFTQVKDMATRTPVFGD